jgi:hypothetical protein
VRTLLFWSGIALLALAGCETSTRIKGSPEDGGVDVQGGAGGGGGLDSSAGDAGTGGSTDAGADGAAAADASSGADADGAAEDGGGCMPSDVTIDFAALGNVQLPRFEQPGVTLVGLADLKFSDRTADEPDAGLGVIGGWFDWAIDRTEFVTVSFGRPATGVSIYVSHALDIDHDDVYGKTTITGFDAEGLEIDRFEFAGAGTKNVSALFGDVPLSKFMVKDDVDGIAIGSLSFRACLE